MKITKKKIKTILEKEYGWQNLDEKSETFWFADDLIKDTISIIDEILKKHKNISIKK